MRKFVVYVVSDFDSIFVVEVESKDDAIRKVAHPDRYDGGFSVFAAAIDADVSVQHIYYEDRDDFDVVVHREEYSTDEDEED